MRNEIGKAQRSQMVVVRAPATLLPLFGLVLLICLPAVAQNTTVCAYDRAGQGWSDPPPSPQGGVAVVTDLQP